MSLLGALSYWRATSPYPRFDWRRSPPRWSNAGRAKLAKLATIAGTTVSLGSEGAKAAVRRTYHDRRGNAPGGVRTMRALSGAKQPATRTVWAGEEGYFVAGVTQVPIVQSIPFGYDDLDEWMGVTLGEREGHIYSRNTNPTTRAFEEKLRALEEAEDSTSFATGMAAISNTLFAFLTPGDRVVSVKDTYGGTNKIFLEFLPRAGVVN